MSLARKYHLKVIEDASQALGAFWRERPCGAFGDISIIRLQGDHLAPSGEGAMLLCNEVAFFKNALTLGDPLRLAEQPPVGHHISAATGPGLNTRMAPLCAAIGLNQFKHLEEHNAMRNDNLIYLGSRLEELGLKAFPAPRHLQRVYSEFKVQYNADQYGLPIERLITALNREGCEATLFGHVPLYRCPLFAEGRHKDILRLPIHSELPDYSAVSLPVTEGMAGSLIQLPAFPGPDNGILDQYLHAFEKVLGHADEIAAAQSGRRDQTNRAFTKLRVVG